MADLKTWVRRIQTNPLEAKRHVKATCMHKKANVVNDDKVDTQKETNKPTARRRKNDGKRRSC